MRKREWRINSLMNHTMKVRVVVLFALRDLEPFSGEGIYYDDFDHDDFHSGYCDNFEDDNTYIAITMTVEGTITMTMEGAIVVVKIGDWCDVFIDKFWP